jgi:predicted AAA+ superfamily ATPase
MENPYLRREIEAVIDEQAAYYPGVLLTGIRQAGKSTLLKGKVGDDDRHLFDDMVEREVATEDPAGYLSGLRYPCLLDEVQKLGSNFFPALKAHFERHPEKGQIFLTGSQPIQLLKAAKTESLAGRIAVLNMSTLSLREMQGRLLHHPFSPTCPDAENPARADLWETIVNGSFPERFRLGQPPRLFYPSYLELYLKKDVSEVVEIRDSVAFDHYLGALAAQSGSMLNYDRIARDVGTSLDTIRRWTAVLKDLGIIYFLTPYYNNAFSRAVRTPKVYFMDTGLVCYLGRWLTRETAEHGAMAGALYETFVVSEIVKSFLNSGSSFDRLPLYFYNGRDRIRKTVDGRETVYGQSEIDLIIEEGDTLYPIEIKKTESPTSSMASSFDVLDKDTSHHRGIGTILCNYPTKQNLNPMLQVLNPNMI